LLLRVREFNENKEKLFPHFGLILIDKKQESSFLTDCSLIVGQQFLQAAPVSGCKERSSLWSSV
jgi:hypothetical protein